MRRLLENDSISLCGCRRVFAKAQVLGELAQNIDKALFTCFRHEIRASLVVTSFAPQNEYTYSGSVGQTLGQYGYAVSYGGALNDYSAFDQVWDLRYNVTLSSNERSAMNSYLAGGGRMYLTGERGNYSTFRQRNNSLVSLVDEVGGGTLSLHNTSFSGRQYFTTAGQAVNANGVNYLNFNAAELVQDTSTLNGFLVTKPNNSTGSVVAWDFGDMGDSPNARMVIGMDINSLIRTTYNPYADHWIDNIATFLDSANVVPAPSSIVGLLGMSVMGFFFLVRRRWKEARS